MAMTQEQANELGGLIAEARIRKGMSLADLAQLLGVHRSWVGYVEQGRYLDSGSKRLAQLVDVLEIDTATIERITNGSLSAGLPDARAYFRAKFGLSPEETDRVQRYIKRVRSQS